MINVVESTGKCKHCGKMALLGDGLCEKCWDVAKDSYSCIRGVKMSYSMEVVCLALQLLDSGMSCVKVREAVREQYGVSPSMKRIYAWNNTERLRGEIAKQVVCYGSSS